MKEGAVQNTHNDEYLLKGMHGGGIPTLCNNEPFLFNEA